MLYYIHLNIINFYVVILYIIAAKEYTTVSSGTSQATPCPEIDVMTDSLLSAENLETSSNSINKTNLLSGDSPWTSHETDQTPTVAITLSDSDKIMFTELMLVNPTNVNTFNVTIADANGETVYTSVNTHLHRYVLL